MDPLKRTRPTPNCVLVNFGDNMRVVYDVDNIPVQIRSGDVKQAALPDVTIAFISKAMPNDPLCVFQDTVELPDRVKECLAILAVVSTEEYDKLLQRATALVGKEVIGTTRPSRGELMAILKPIALTAQRVVIKEQVPTKDDPRRTPDAPAPKADDLSDGVLGDLIEPTVTTQPDPVSKTKKKRRERIKI